jgi:hypothetical protein
VDIPELHVPSPVKGQALLLAQFQAVPSRDKTTGNYEPHDLLRALAGVAHVRPSRKWKQSAIQMVDILLKGMQGKHSGSRVNRRPASAA